MSTPVSLSAARRAVERFGSHALAYSVLQPGMQYFGSSEQGIIAYRRSLGQTIVLGDPVADANSMDTLLREFLQAHPRSLHMQIHRGTADLLASRGFRITPVGVENEIALEEFSLHGKRKADLRHYRNRAAAGAVVVQEEKDSVALRRALEPVSRAWLPLKTGHGAELEFLARPFILEPEPGARIFTARIEGALVGFVVMDPMYAEGKVAGYTVTILRHRPDSPEGTVDAINLFAFEQFAREGIPMVSLGVSPFHQLADLARTDGIGAPAIYLVYRFLNDWGDRIYHFRGLSFHKSRYRAREVPVYTAVRGPIGLWPLFASAWACKML